MSDNTHQKIFVSDKRFVMFIIIIIMAYIEYVTVQSDHGKQLDEHRNPCSTAVNIWMIVANIFLRRIYAAHPMIAVVHNSWNPDTNLTTFYPDFVHASLVLLVHSRHSPNIFLNPQQFVL